MPSDDGTGFTLGGRLILSVAGSFGVAAAIAVLVGVVWAAVTRGRRSAPAAGPAAPDGESGPEPHGRRALRVAFGVLWIVDGALQAQPAMPGSFVGTVTDPARAGLPAWLAGLIASLGRAWMRHPVAADVATVCVQVGLGVGLLLAVRGPLARFVVWASIAWGLVVWVAGEGLGGLFARGASWLSGAPGAVLVYVAAAVALLLPDRCWTDGTAARAVRRFSAAWFALGAVLHAWPGEGLWHASGISAAFDAAATRAQPAVLADPIARVASAAHAHPVAVNLLVIALLVSASAALLATDERRVVVAVLVFCGASWWIGQDFGVLGGTGTDPNSALPLALLLAAALLTREPDRAPVPEATAEAATPRPATAPGQPALGAFARGAGGAFVVALVVALPLAILTTLGRPAGADALALDSQGGVRHIPPRPAPAFALTDQRGQAVSTASLRGKLVLITFLDPVCTSDCPLIAHQLAQADRRLAGSAAGRVEFVAVDTNPVFRYRADVAAFTQSHGLADLTNWHFLTGPPRQVQRVLDGYGIAVAVPAVGMIEHSEGVFFVGPDGRESAYLDDRAAPSLTSTYAERIGAEIRRLLP